MKSNLLRKTPIYPHSSFSPVVVSFILWLDSVSDFRQVRNRLSIEKGRGCVWEDLQQWW
jgi:hypothetical protein